MVFKCLTHAEHCGTSHKSIFGTWMNELIFGEVGTPDFDSPFFHFFFHYFFPFSLKPRSLGKTPVAGWRPGGLRKSCAKAAPGEGRLPLHGDRGHGVVAAGDSKALLCAMPMWALAGARRFRNADAFAPGEMGFEGGGFLKDKAQKWCPGGLREVTWDCDTPRAEPAWFSDSLQLTNQKNTPVCND